MAVAWLVTLPAAGLIGAAAFLGADLVGGTTGVMLVFAVAAVLAAALYLASRRNPVHAGNVNDDWTGSRAESDPVPVG